MALVSAEDEVIPSQKTIRIVEDSDNVPRPLA